MTSVDWGVIAMYLVALLCLAIRLAPEQTSREAYYLAGRRSSPLALALSTMATQCSSASLLGAPAFVAFSLGGGLGWLQYELAVPLAMAFLLLTLYPALRRHGAISVYSFLEARLGVRSRVLASLLFQLFRAAGAAVTVYGMALVLTLCLDLSFSACVALLAAVTLIYDLLGGMRAVILSDVIQLIVLVSVLVLALILALSVLGGLPGLLAHLPEARVQSLDLQHTGLGDGVDYAFWPMLFGGFFLYVSYYGCDQSQSQRLLASESVTAGQRILWYNGLLRFPLVLLYCLLGLCLAAYANFDGTFLGRLPVTEQGAPNINLAVVQFVFDQFPPGLVGLVIVALLAAAMSSIDSVLNALSAASSEDLIGRWPRGAELEARFGPLRIAKALTLFWGLMIVALAFYVGDIADSVLVAINKIGSLLNGPLLALFLIAAFAPAVGEGAALRGLAAGMALNAALWLGAPGVSWLWWNVFGCLATLAVAGLSALPQLASSLGAALADRGGRVAALSLLSYSGFIGLACALGSMALAAGIAP